MINVMAKRHWREKTLLHLTGFGPSFREAETRAEQEPLRSPAYWLAPWLQLTPFYKAQAYLPRGGIAHSRPGPPASIRSQEDAHRLGHGSGGWRQFFS